jgi:hypothetical protein
MRLVITAVTGGEQVGRMIVEERDAQNAVSTVVYQALGLFRDSAGKLDAPDTVTVTVEAHRLVAVSAPGHTHDDLVNPQD